MSDRLNRVRQGNEARERILSGTYNQQPSQIKSNRRSDRIRAYDEKEEQRKQQVLSTAPEITSNSGLDILKNSPLFKQPVVQAPPPKIDPSIQRLVNQEVKLQSQNRGLEPQYQTEQQASQDFINQRAFERKNMGVPEPLDWIANKIDKAQVNNPVGRFLTNVGSTAGKVLGVDTQASGGAPVLSTGNKVADIAAQLLGAVGGFSTNPAQLEQSLFQASEKIASGLLKTKAGSKSLNTISNTIENELRNRGINISTQAAQRIAQNLTDNAIQGAVQNTAIGAAAGKTGLGDVIHNASEGALFGGAGGALLGEAGAGISKLRQSKVHSVAPETSLPQQVERLPEDITTPVKRVEVPKLNIREPEIMTPEQEAAAFEAFKRIPSNRSSKVTKMKEEIPTAPERNTVDIQPNERGFITNMRSSQTTAPEVVQGLESSVQRTHEPITNAETLRKANDLINTKGVDIVEAQLLNKSKFNADDVAQGMRVIQELQNSGNINRAVTMAEKLATKLTEAGQTVQAASIWNRLSPEGALLYAQRKVNKINEDLLKGQTPAKISEKQADDILSSAQAIQASGASKERAGQVMDIADRLKKGEAISPSEKQIITDFVTDLKTFVKPAKPLRNTSLPKEFKDTRVRDRVVDFMDKQEQAALERIKARRGRLSSTPFDEWADYALVGASRLAKGAVKFSDWSSSMISDFGDEIRPHLAKIFQRSQEELTQNSKKITEQVVSRAENIAENYLKKNESTISVEDADFIRNMARNVSSLSGDAQRLASQDLQAIMSGFEKAGIGRKISSAQYISMLLNPKTQIRNIVGNELMYRIERLSRLIGTPIDIIASKVSGGPRQITFKSGPSVFDDFFTPSKDYWTSLPEGAKAGARGVSPEGLQSKYEIQGQAFKSKYNPLTYMEKALGASLQGFDYAAYTRATNQRMREMAYLDALNKGIKGDDAIRDYMQTYMTNLDDATHAISRDYGKFSTLQNDSGLASKLMGFRRGVNQLTAGNKDFGAGSLILPFAKTPANLLLRGIDYSPLGILKAVKQTSDILLKNNTDLTRADVIDSVSRSLMGTGMGAVAYWLADKGAMFGQTNADPEVRKLQQLSGIKDFQINGTALQRMLQAITSGGNVDEAAKIQPGDTLWSYEWAQPTSMPMAIGSNIYRGIKEQKGAARTVGEAALSGLNTLLDSSVLSGIQEAFKVNTGEDNAVKAIAMNLVKQIPSMATPSIVRNINTFLDGSVKETYDPDVATSIINPARSNIPGLSQQLPQRVDTLGNPQTRPNSFFDVFVSPADRSKYNPTKEAQLVIDLLNETGNKNLAPRAVAKYISGKDSTTRESRKVDLTPEQYVRLQTIVGQETTKRLGNIDSDLPTDKKVDLVLKALTDAGKIGRNELKNELGISPTK